MLKPRGPLITSLDGDAIEIVTLMANQVRPAQDGEIAYVRALEVE